MSLRYDNIKPRGAGIGVIPAGTKPMKRGIWDMYETTNPYIGLFERCFWIEFNYESWPGRDLREAALDELATFFDQNIKDNIIVLEYAHIRVMGGVVNMTAGKAYFQEKKHRGKKKKFSDEYMASGYELRLSERDAITFATLWKGYEPEA